MWPGVCLSVTRLYCTCMKWPNASSRLFFGKEAFIPFPSASVTLYYREILVSPENFFFLNFAANFWIFFITLLTML